MNSFIEIHNVGKVYRKKDIANEVLSKINLQLDKPGIVSIVGKSGCGKSTLLNLIAGLDLATSGSIKIFGNLSFAEQYAALLPWRTLLENVLLAIEIKKKVENSDLEKAKCLLKLLRLESDCQKFPEELSGGMKQRAALARVLITNPDILLFDEPLSAVDYDTRLQLIRELRNYVKINNKICLFVTHNIDEAIAISDQIITLAGSPTTISKNYLIDIAEDQREAAEIRKTEIYKISFENIWKEISR